MTISRVNPPPAIIRSMAARLHPTSKVQFLLQVGETYLELDLIQADLSQLHEDRGGNAVPSSPPSLLLVFQQLGPYDHVLFGDPAVAKPQGVISVPTKSAGAREPQPPGTT